MGDAITIKFVTQAPHVKLRPLKGLAATIDCQAERLEDLSWLGTKGNTGCDLVVIDPTIPCDPKMVSSLPAGYRYFVIRSKSSPNVKKWIDAFNKNESVVAVVFSDADSFLKDQNVLQTLKSLIRQSKSPTWESQIGWGHLKREAVTLDGFEDLFDDIELDLHLARQFDSCLSGFEKGCRKQGPNQQYYFLCDGIWLVIGIDWGSQSSNTDKIIRQATESCCKSSGSVNLVVCRIAEDRYQIAWSSLINDPLAPCSAILCRHLDKKDDNSAA